VAACITTAWFVKQQSRVPITPLGVEIRSDGLGKVQVGRYVNTLNERDVTVRIDTSSTLLASIGDCVWRGPSRSNR
jgi:hypothetical protein